MKLLTTIAMVAFIATAVLEAQTTDADTAGWKTYGNESGEYQIKYPNALSLRIPSGKTCGDGKCKAIEEVMRMGSDDDGKSQHQIDVIYYSKRYQSSASAYSAMV